METLDTVENIRIVYNGDEPQPWELKFHDVNILKKAMIMVSNHSHKFNTEVEAISAAAEITDLINADTLDVLNKWKWERSQLNTEPLSIIVPNYQNT